jgi:hypothetical protein
MMKLKIANINVDIDIMDNDFLYNKCVKYQCNDFTNTGMYLKTYYVDEITVPEGKIIEKINNTTVIQISENRYCRHIINKDTGKTYMAIFYDNIYSEVDIHIMKNISQPGFSLAGYEYMYTGFAFKNRLIELDGAVLHGSAIAYNNQGIIFSANSGVGKSTHSSLWKERFGSKVMVVNDDKPAIRFYDEIPYIFGTPWSGKTGLNKNVQIQLKSIVFIKRAETNRIERLNTRDSIFSLMSQISRPYYDVNIGLKTMDVIEKLVKTVPIYRLHCNISEEAVDTAYQQMIKEGVISI